MKINISLASELVCPSPEIHKAFKALADQQRGVPESMFSRKHNPGCEHSGAWQWAMEHTGDLIHRAAQADLPEWGLEALDEKVHKIHRALTATLPLGRDIERQLRSNYEYQSEAARGNYKFNGSLEKWEQMAYDAGRRYSKAYDALEPLTHLQALGKEAAVSLGRSRWTDMSDAISELKQLLGSGKAKKIYFELL